MIVIWIIVVCLIGMVLYTPVREYLYSRKIRKMEKKSWRK